MIDYKYIDIIAQCLCDETQHICCDGLTYKELLEGIGAVDMPEGCSNARKEYCQGRIDDLKNQAKIILVNLEEYINQKISYNYNEIARKVTDLYDKLMVEKCPYCDHQDMSLVDECIEKNRVVKCKNCGRKCIPVIENGNFKFRPYDYFSQKVG